MTGHPPINSGPPHDATREGVDQRYREASAADPRRPAERVRAAVLAHAQMQLDRGNDAAADQADTPSTARAPAANQSRWQLSLLASLALAGLTGLLVLQFERGTTHEKELALGQKSASESAAPSPLPAPSLATPPSSPPFPSPSPSPSSSPAPQSSSAAASPPASPEAIPPVIRPPATQPPRPAPPLAPKDARQAGPSPVPQLPMPTMPSTAPAPPLATSPSPFPASPQSASPARSKAESPPGLADAPPAASPGAPDQTTEAARQDESATGRLREAAPRAAPPPPAPVAASPLAAPRAQAPNQSRIAGAAPNALNQLDAAPDAKSALQQAARSGSLAQLDRLLARGMALQSVLNAPDDAGRTPLILAVINGHAAMVQRLLALGANPALVDQGGINALQHARQRGRPDIAALIESAP